MLRLTVGAAFGALLLTSANGNADFDLCEWDLAQPQLYHSYNTTACPPAFTFAANGMDCEEDRPYKNVCASFCQMRTIFYYGQEQPYIQAPLCRGETRCKLSESIHQGYSWKIKMNGAFKEGALTTGITGGYNSKSGISQSWSFTKDIPQGECGYWTLVPFVREACGTYSQAAVINDQCDPPIQTTGNACIEQLIHFNSGGDWSSNFKTVHGVVLFVFVDCLTLAVSPDSMQDPVYLQPGVKLPRDYPLWSTYQTLWKNQQSSDDFLANSDTLECFSSSTHPPPASFYANSSDCIDAITQLQDAGNNYVGLGKTGKGVAPSQAGSCSVNVIYDENWDDGKCTTSVSFLEVAAAGYGILDGCENSDGVGGNHPLRGNGNCASHVSLTSVDEAPGSG